MVLQLQVWAFMLLQEGGAAIGFDPRTMWDQMGWLAQASWLSFCSLCRHGRSAS